MFEDIEQRQLFGKRHGVDKGSRLIDAPSLRARC